MRAFGGWTTHRALHLPAERPMHQKGREKPPLVRPPAVGILVQRVVGRRRGPGRDASRYGASSAPLLRPLSLAGPLVRL